MSITAKVKKRVIDTGRIFDVLVQGENRSHKIIFAIPNETMEVSGSEVFLKDCYFYLLYKRKGDAVPQIPLLLTKTYDLSSDTISASFEPTSYFTEKEGALEVQVFACSTEESFITGDVDIEDIALWTTFAAQISISKSQLKNSQTIVAEDMFTKGIAEISAYLDAAEEEADASEEFASDAEEYAKGTRSDGRPVTHGTDNAKYYSEQAGGYSEASASSASDSYAYKLDSEAARDKAEDWATKTDGKVDNIDYSAKHYAFESKASEQKASEWAEKETAVETGKYSAKHWAEQSHAEFNALDTYVDETLKPALDDYEEAKEGELDDHTDDKKDDLDTYEGTKETELNTYTGTKKTELDTYTGAKKSELDSYVANTNKPALDNYTNNTLKPALLSYEQTQEGTLNTYTGTKKTELDAYVTNTSKPSIDDYIDDVKKPEIDAYVEEVEGQLAEDVENVKSQVNVVSAEVENINAILEGEADVTNTDPAQGESELSNSRLIHHANLLPNGSFGRVGARSVAWNNIANPANNNTNVVGAGEINGITITYDSSTHKYHITGTPVSNFDRSIIINTPITNGHKYLLNGYGIGFGYTGDIRLYAYSSGNLEVYNGSAVTANGSGVCQIYVYIKAGITVDIYLTVNLHDLTAMNEASLTADQFRSKFPASYYPYNAGTIYDLNPSGFRIRGINLWDEEWEIGSYSSTGQKVTTQGGRIRSVNKIPALPNTSYYALKGVFILCQYDENEDFISFTQLGIDSSSNVGHSFTTEANTHYLAFATYANYGTTYNHDIQICYNSLPTALKTAYHPYEEHTVDTPQISDGHYVNEDCYDYVENVVEDGVPKGKFHDVANEIDMGDITWSYYEADAIFYVTTARMPSDFKKAGKVICSIYETVSSGYVGSGYAEKKLVVWDTYHEQNLVVKDSNYNSASAFKEAMAGKKLIYEKSTETVTDCEPLRSFGISDYSTVEPITPQTELVNRADVPFVVETKSNNGIIEQITTNKNNIEAEVATREAQVVKLQKQIDNLNQGAGGYPEITYPDSTYGTGEVPPNKAKNAQVVNLIMNSRVKNQLVKNGNFADGTANWTAMFSSLSVSDGVASITKSLANPSYIRPSEHYNFIAGHVYLGVAWLKGEYTFIGIQDNTTYTTLTRSHGTPTDSAFTMCSFIYQFGVNDDPASSELAIRNGTGGGADKTFYAKNIILTDLTTYFNGNIPSGLDIATIQKDYPHLLLPSEYGTRIVDAEYSGVRAVGVNIWDEVLVEGVLDSSGNVDTSGFSHRRTTSFIRINPDTAYYQFAPVGAGAYGGRIAFYDYNKNFIYYDVNGIPTTGLYTSPQGAYYMRVTLGSSYGTTYNHDIQFCLYSLPSEVRTVYHPYMESTLTLPEPVTGKSAGSVHQIYYPETGEMTEPLGAVDMGTLSWTCDGTFLEAYVTGKKIGINDLLCPRYVTSYVQYATQMVDGQIRGHAASTLVTVKDSSKIDPNKTNAENASAFKTAMDGVILLYELATPNPNSQATDPVIADMIETEGGGSIEAVQSQETKIDSSFTIGYMNI